MTEISVRDFKAKLSHYFDLMAGGEVFNVRGLDIGCVTTPVTTEKKVDHMVTTLSDEDIERVAERFAELIYPKLNTPKSGDLRTAEVGPIDKQKAFSDLRGTLDNFDRKSVEYIEADAHSLGDKSVGWGDVWIKMKKSDLPKNFEIGNTRPVQEEVQLETYDTGFKMHNRATSMNDGSKPIPKPVKKKKT